MYVCVCVRACVHVCVRACVHAYMHMHACACVHVSTCVHAYVRTCMCVFACALKKLHVHYVVIFVSMYRLLQCNDHITSGWV